ncbi:MAG: energy transducer TonB, partial [Pseudomonadota bacterium]
PAAAAPAPAPSTAPAAAEAPLEAARFDAAYLRNPPPPYPPLSRRLGEQGKVQLRVHVNTEGLPTAVEIKSSSGSPRLDEAALETVRKWRFVPARQGDRPVAAWVVVPINFRLEG